MIANVSTDYRRDPFPHTTASGLISAPFAEATLSWMEKSAPWRLKVASFYEQWELHLDASVLPMDLRCLVSNETVRDLERLMLSPIADGDLQLIEVTAHKLVPGQTIRIHNDYIPGEETHRLLVQLNRGWSNDQGGVLMLFGSSEPNDIMRALMPTSRSSFAFEISPASFHAVSTISGGERFTIVYSFRSSQH